MAGPGCWCVMVEGLWWRRQLPHRRGKLFIASGLGPYGPLFLIYIYIYFLVATNSAGEEKSVRDGHLLNVKAMRESYLYLFPTNT